MPVKSRSKTFKPGDKWDDTFMWINGQINCDGGAIEPSDKNAMYPRYIVKKRLIITITYDRDDKTE